MSIQTKNLFSRISIHRKKLPIKPFFIRYFLCDKSSYYRIALEHFLIDKYNPLLIGFSQKDNEWR